MFSTTANGPTTETEAEKQPQSAAVTEYCAQLQQWMWHYHWGYASWQSWAALSAFPFPSSCSFLPPGISAQTPRTPAPTYGTGEQGFDTRNWYNNLYPFSFPASSFHPAAQTEQSPAGDARPAQLQNGNLPHTGREYIIASPLRRLLAESVDFFILFCVKATIVLWIMYLSGIKDFAKFITHFIVEEIDENTSMEDLQKMMAVALVYRVLVCVYEIICIWGAGGATPGKFLLGLQVVKCDTTALIRPNRVLVVPASNVSLSATHEDTPDYFPKSACPQTSDSIGCC
ncbi:protein FAM8A1 isoform X2 [Channa argus]|uniref:protein FAM8A1 isoform X2 n=1 Tax=Channa argus TaxID=215402 RepID=UPI0035213A44